MMTQPRDSGARELGFTLISLMIVVAIIGILAAIAYPSYMNYVRKSRRTQAISALTRAANEQAQYYSLNHEYEYADDMSELGLGLDCDKDGNNDDPCITDGDSYKVSISSTASKSYIIKAVPINAQEYDLCQKFTIEETGEKNAYNDKGQEVTDKCW